MIYSKECEYAIRALTYLSLHPERRCLSREIAEDESLPGFFLSKILQTLARARLLNSVKGPNGGFQLAKSPDEITLFEIRQILDGNDDLEACAVGLGECHGLTPCPLHESFKPIRDQIKDYLHHTTLELMAKAVQEKQPQAKR